MSDNVEPQSGETPWPNQQPVKDGVREVSQDPLYFADNGTEEDADGDG